jgi:hypothetical protein
VPRQVGTVRRLDEAQARIWISHRLPRAAQGHPLEHAVAKLRSAQGFFLQGKCETIVATCCTCLEALQAVTGKPEVDVVGFYASKNCMMSRAERRDLLQLADFHLATLAAHHSPTDPAVFSRGDANLVLGTTSTLVEIALSRQAGEAALPGGGLQAAASRQQQCR